jgi:hypothetical protein
MFDAFGRVEAPPDPPMTPNRHNPHLALYSHQWAMDYREQKVNGEAAVRVDTFREPGPLDFADSSPYRN